MDFVITALTWMFSRLRHGLL